MSSKFEMIESAIAERDDIEVVLDIQANTVLDDLKQGVAPRLQRDLYLSMVDPEYNHRRLDEVARSLCPEVVPDKAVRRNGLSGDLTWWKTWAGLEIGERRYTDTVGQVVMMTMLDGPSMQYLTLKPGEIGMYQYTKTVQHVTTVKLYPDKELAHIGRLVNDGGSNLLPAREVKRARRKHRALGKSATQLVEA